MALSLTYTIANGATWSFIDNNNSQGYTFSDVGAFSAASGITVNTTGRLFHGRVSIPSGQSVYRLDLFSLTQSQFSGSLPVSFSGGKLFDIYVKNPNSGQNDVIYLSSTGANHFFGHIGNTTGYPIRPLTASHFTNLQGWTISTGRYIDFKPVPSTGLNFDVALFGAVP